jgi:hypothetical protein
MPDWSIKIINTPNGAAFVPDLFGAQPGSPVGSQPGSPLAAQVDDLVTWNNTTDQPHWPWPTDQNFKPLPDSQVSVQAGNYLSDQIPPNRSSRPSYDVNMPATGNTIYYCCKLNPQMRGTITVTPIPQLQQPVTS